MCKIEVDLPVDNKETQSEDIKMREQNNITNSLAQGKYPWGFIKKVNQTANSFNRLPDGSRFLGRNIIDEFVIKLQRKKRSNIDRNNKL